MCTAGWTLMDWGLEMVEFFSDKLRSKLKQAKYPNNEEWKENSEFFGSVLGYLASFAIFFLHSGKTFKVQIK